MALPSGRLPAAQVLQAALDADLDAVVVIGRDASGEIYLASSEPAAHAFWELHVAARALQED